MIPRDVRERSRRSADRVASYARPVPVVRPCIERLPDDRGCPEYAIPGKSRCERHEAEAVKNRNSENPGTTPEWRRARKAALERDGHRCTRCGKTQAQAKAESKHNRGLEVHHMDGEGSSRQGPHDLDKLATLCHGCHKAVRVKKTRPTLEEYRAAIMARARARST